jgi:hypothetical protein
MSSWNILFFYEVKTSCTAHYAINKRAVKLIALKFMAGAKDPEFKIINNSRLFYI